MLGSLQVLVTLLSHLSTIWYEHLAFQCLPVSGFSPSLRTVQPPQYLLFSLQIWCGRTVADLDIGYSSSRLKSAANWIGDPALVK